MAFLGLLASFSCRGASEPQWSELTQQIRSRFPDVHQLSTAGLAKDLESSQSGPPVLIDSRSEIEYAVSHLRGAQRAETVSEVEAITEQRDTFIVVYCSVGYRSSRLAEDLMNAGFTNVFNLEGSIFKWANEGRPVYRDGQPVAEVHPYDDDWGRLLDRSLWRYSVK
jgi:rhodanese-related sulfurtransferase